ncbi:MAG: hypothetical protein AAB477_00415 [Patescibacteria group bacterium]
MRINKRNLNSGFIGLLMLLIGVAIIIFFIVRTDLFTGNKDGKNMIEQKTSALDQAKDVKAQLEENSRKATEQQ